jgi:hypothetical protein
MTRRSGQAEGGAEKLALPAVGAVARGAKTAALGRFGGGVNGGSEAAFPQGRDLQEGRNARILLTRKRSEKKYAP